MCFRMSYKQVVLLHKLCDSVWRYNDKYECELLNADMFKQLDKFAASRDFHHYNNKVSSNFTVVSLIFK